MQQAPMIILEAKLESRMSRIFEEYVVEHLDEIRGTACLPIRFMCWRSALAIAS